MSDQGTAPPSPESEFRRLYRKYRLEGKGRNEAVGKALKESGIGITKAFSVAGEIDAAENLVVTAAPAPAPTPEPEDPPRATT